MQPFVLGPNTPDTFYRGAGRISTFRGTAFDPPSRGLGGSTTARFGAAPAGLTRLADGSLLVDAIAADPVELARRRARRPASAPNPALLVKLLDAGQRLPLHVHPDRRFARSHLASPFGKTEAWVILDAPADAYVHLGFARDVEAAELASGSTRRTSRRCSRRPTASAVAPGDAVLCPAGTPHAIGEGILLLELQEPTDFSVLLEWDGFALTADDATLGLPRDARARVRRPVALRRGSAGRAAGHARMRSARCCRPRPTTSSSPSECGRAPSTPDFSVLVVTAGAGELRYADGPALPISRGQTIVIPYSAGAGKLSGGMTAIRCRAGRPARDGAD